MILLFLGVPVAFALAGAGILGTWIITGNFSVVLGVVGTTTFSTVAHFVLTTLPMFVLMAYLASASGIAEELYNAGSKWLSSTRGGLGIATVFACAIFGAMSGSSTAASTVMAKIAMPNMRRFGYSDSLAGGVIACGSTLNALIPPSVALVIYGMMTEQSIGKLLMAGVMPGILVAILLSICILAWVMVRPEDAPRGAKETWSLRLKSLFQIWPGILLIALVLGSLYAGIATPTEVGALGAIFGAIIGFSTGSLTLSGALDALKGTVQTTAMIFMIVIGGMIFGYYMTLSQMPQQMIGAIGEWNINRWLIMAAIITGYFLISMFMDEIPLLIITVQVTYPLILHLKFDPIWYGIINIMMGSMGLVFPPVGMSAFIVSATGNVDLVKVYKGSSTLMIGIVIATVLLCIFPEIATWLPSMMRTVR
jgi:C4-dicarboxylate transporter DctM subunit